MTNKAKVTVITVCRNEVNNISFTIDSVLAQDPDLYEFLILDGKSDDGTLEIIRNYEKQFIEKNIDYTIVSEKDTGIYNAMNKGIRLAKNPYCIFMNGGDGFYDSHVIEDALAVINKTGPDVLYGDSCRFDEKTGTKEKYVSNVSELLWNCTIAHQSSFIRTELLKERNYDESFVCAADYEYWLYLLSINAVFGYAGRVFSYFRIGGVSTKRYKLSMSEVEIIQERYRNRVLPQIRKVKNNRYVFKRDSGISNKGAGWSNAEREGAWAIGNKSLFYAYMKKKDCRLTAKVRYYFDYSRKLFLNDKYLCDVIIDNNLFECSIDRKFINEGLNVFSFETPGEVRRCDSAPGTADYRRLNMFVEEIVIESCSRYRFRKLKTAVIRLLKKVWNRIKAVLKRIKAVLKRIREYFR